MFLRPPDHDPEQTRALHTAIRARKVRALHALIRKGVYVDSTAFELALGHLPKQVDRLRDHMRKTFYG
jgi:hypothetical protein